MHILIHSGFFAQQKLVSSGNNNDEEQGTAAKAIAKAFPKLECTCFDLPHVVNGLESDLVNLKYVGGDMFKAISPADAVVLKWILHDWNNEECVKILKKCKEAITSDGKKGKSEMRKNGPSFLRMQVLVIIKLSPFWV
ncbi:hypothetical protein WN944_003340 [Citrus x changshan-huyou]|uniref:O-methyltransferase C-terminal domain-containing protein n=1 Tax=Citrus x changshan-huyou TaxID=2935761 RepID=A0AAP0LYB4_9ROSI